MEVRWKSAVHPNPLARTIRKSLINGTRRPKGRFNYRDFYRRMPAEHYEAQHLRELTAYPSGDRR